MERPRSSFEGHRRRRSSDGWQPRSAYRHINTAPSRRITNAFYGCEWSTPPARTEPTPTPPRRPTYHSRYRASENDSDGLLLLSALGLSEIVSLVGSYEIAHNFIRPIFGGDANNPEALALGVAMFVALIPTVIIFDRFAENPDLKL